MYKFHQSLSAETVRLRYFGFRSVESRVRDERLPQARSRDDNDKATLVAERIGFEETRRQIIAVAHLSRVPLANEAELAIVVSDEWQGKGLGTTLLYQLVEVGRAQDLERLFGYVLLENYVMRHICRKLGFTMKYSAYLDAIEAAITLRRSPNHSGQSPGPKPPSRSAQRT